MQCRQREGTKRGGMEREFFLSRRVQSVRPGQPAVTAFLSCLPSVSKQNANVWPILSASSNLAFFFFFFFFCPVLFFLPFLLLLQTAMSPMFLFPFLFFPSSFSYSSSNDLRVGTEKWNTMPIYIQVEEEGRRREWQQEKHIQALEA